MNKLLVPRVWYKPTEAIEEPVKMTPEDSFMYVPSLETVGAYTLLIADQMEHTVELSEEALQLLQVSTIVPDAEFGRQYIQQQLKAVASIIDCYGLGKEFKVTLMQEGVLAEV